MSKLVGQIEKGQDEAYIIVSTSTGGVELECEPSFTLTPERALELAGMLIAAAQERIAYAQEIAGEIRDPAKLAELVPIPADARRNRRVVHRSSKGA